MSDCEQTSELQAENKAETGAPSASEHAAAPTAPRARSAAAVSLPSKRRVINNDLLLTVASAARGKDETTEKFLERLTHLHLQNKRIGRIKGLTSCPATQNLYLYDNYIEVIENLDELKNLKRLLLQNNFITCIPRLKNSNLIVLRLDENDIHVIEGLEECTQLEELSVANQRITSPLVFDPKSLQAIASTLRVLDISGTMTSTLAPITCLRYLETLRCSNNSIVDLSEIDNIRYFQQLVEVNFSGNLIATAVPYKYRNAVLCSAPRTLDRFDDAPVLQTKAESVKAAEMHRARVVGQHSRRGVVQGVDVLKDLDNYACSPSAVGSSL
jgi:Leucine-rich repeat (LRR) protein